MKLKKSNNHEIDFFILQDDDDPDPSRFLECGEIIEGDTNEVIIKTEPDDEDIEDDDPGFVFM